MSYYNTLSSTMSTMFVRGISEMAELFVAIKRLEGFLLNQEYVEVEALPSGDEKKAISLVDATVRWNAEAKDVALDHINLKIHTGQLYGVIGPVGSGKSSLLQTILSTHWKQLIN